MHRIHATFPLTLGPPRPLRGPCRAPTPLRLVGPLETLMGRQLSPSRRPPLLLTPHHLLLDPLLLSHYLLLKSRLLSHHWLRKSLLLSHYWLLHSHLLAHHGLLKSCLLSPYWLLKS